MSKLLKFTEARLVGISFICLCLVLGLPAVQASSGQASYGDAARAVQDSPYGSHGSDLLQSQKDSSVGELSLPQETIYFPWAGRAGKGFESSAGIISPLGPSNEEIHMDGSRSKEQLGDMRAINTVKQRDVIYDGVSTIDAGSGDFAEPMDISITGKGHFDQSDRIEKDNFGDGIESRVDDALSACMDGGKKGSFGGKNEMNIDVSGISVSAVNTVPGGKAVVNSNIIIKPVQIIVLPSSSGKAGKSPDDLSRGQPH